MFCYLIFILHEALRSRPGSPLPNGHKTILFQNAFVFLLIATAIVIYVFISSKKKRKSKSQVDGEGRFYILGKDAEEGKSNLFIRTSLDLYLWIAIL